MRKIMLFLLCVFFFVTCVSEQDEIEKYMENRVEVVANKIKPYGTEGEPNVLYLAELFRIDSEKKKMVEIGLTNIQSFDVDSKGNIYLFKPPLSSDHLVYKFDSEGSFTTSFGRRGQGPGEIQYAAYSRITANDEIPIVDCHGLKYLLFNEDGNLIKEIRLPFKMTALGVICPLENGNYLVRMRSGPTETGFDDAPVAVTSSLSLCDSEFKVIKDLDISTSKMPDHPYLIPIWIWEFSNDKIYIGKSIWGYEIRVFDLDGNLIRKIKKKYNPVKFPEYIKTALKRLTEQPYGRYSGKKLIFPTYRPPFQNVAFTDDNGRFFVMTFEREKDTKGFIFDIFNKDGIFIGRKCLDVYVEGAGSMNNPLYAQAKKDRLYCLREKENGFKEVVVYKTVWE